MHTSMTPRGTAAEASDAGGERQIRRAAWSVKRETGGRRRRLLSTEMPANGGCGGAEASAGASAAACRSVDGAGLRSPRAGDAGAADQQRQSSPAAASEGAAQQGIALSVRCPSVHSDGREAECSLAVEHPDPRSSGSPEARTSRTKPVVRAGPLRRMAGTVDGCARPPRRLWRWPSARGRVARHLPERGGRKALSPPASPGRSWRRGWTATRRRSAPRCPPFRRPCVHRDESRLIRTQSAETRRMR